VDWVNGSEGACRRQCFCLKVEDMMTGSLNRNGLYFVLERKDDTITLLVGDVLVCSAHSRYRPQVRQIYPTPHESKLGSSAVLGQNGQVYVKVTSSWRIVMLPQLLRCVLASILIGDYSARKPAVVERERNP